MIGGESYVGGLQSNILSFFDHNYKCIKHSIIGIIIADEKTRKEFIMES